MKRGSASKIDSKTETPSKSLENPIIRPAFVQPQSSRSSNADLLTKSARRLSLGIYSSLSNRLSARAPAAEDVAFSSDEDESDWNDKQLSSSANGKTLNESVGFVNAHWSRSTPGQLLITSASRLLILQFTTKMDLSVVACCDITSVTGFGALQSSQLLESPHSQRGRARIWSNEPLIALGYASQTKSTLVIYSVSAKTVIKQLQLSGIIHKIECNKAFVVVACRQPASITILDSGSLTPTAYSPVQDVDVDENGNVVFDLGSARLLAYCTTTAPEVSSARRVSSKRDFLSPDSTPSLQQSSEMARRVSLSLFSGVKSISGYSYQYLKRAASTQLSVPSEPRAVSAPSTSDRVVPPGAVHPKRERQRSLPPTTRRRRQAFVSVVDLKNDSAALFHSTLTGHTNVSLLSISADGARLFVASEATYFSVVDLAVPDGQSPVEHRLQRSLRLSRPVSVDWRGSYSVLVFTSRGTIYKYGLPVSANGNLVPPEWQLPMAREQDRSTHKQVVWRAGLRDFASIPPSISLLSHQQLFSHVGTHLERRFGLDAARHSQSLFYFPHLNRICLCAEVSEVDNVSSQQSKYWPAQSLYWPIGEINTTDFQLVPSKARAHSNGLSQVEISTFASSSRPIYISSQFSFATFQQSFDFGKGILVPSTSTLALRKQVEVAKSASLASLTEPIQMAVKEDLHIKPSSFSPGSPDYIPPSLGNGQFGKGRSAWPINPSSWDRFRQRGSASPDPTPALDFDDMDLLSNGMPDQDSTSDTPQTSLGDPQAADDSDNWKNWNISSPRLTLTPPLPANDANKIVDDTFLLDEEIKSDRLIAEPADGDLISLGTSPQTVLDIPTSADPTLSDTSTSSKSKPKRRKK